jgi:HTH-type transcriptional regulator/antitoxin HigA
MATAPIETDADLDKALRRIDALWSKKHRSKKAADELKVLAILVEEYERRSASVGPPTPIEAIRFRMDQLGIKTIKLAEHMGTTRARASEVLNGKRKLTLPMIRRLARSLDLSADVLIGTDESEKRSA